MFKHIGKYLKIRRDQGLVLYPICNRDRNANVLKFDDHPNAGFEGTYEYGKNTDPGSMKSRTESVITVKRCPVL